MPLSHVLLFQTDGRNRKFECTFSTAACILNHYIMSDIKATDPNELVHEDKIVAEEQVEGDASQEGSEMVEPNEGNAMPSSEQEVVFCPFVLLYRSACETGRTSIKSIWL